MTDPTRRVQAPNRCDINTGIVPVTQAFMLDLLGVPGPRGEACGAVHPMLQKWMVTQSAGPFRVTGHRQAVASLKAILADVHDHAPQTWAHLGTEGMLCCRAVRGAPGFYSNHSWGMAIDIRCGLLDELGSDLCASGMLDVYKAMHAHGWFWGAGFGRRDCMHFEPGKSLLREWREAGLI